MQVTKGTWYIVYHALFCFSLPPDSLRMRLIRYTWSIKPCNYFQDNPFKLHHKWNLVAQVTLVTTKYPQESREDPDMTFVMNYHIHEFAHEAESKQTGLANRYSLILRPLFVTLQFVFTTTHTQNGKVMESSFTN